jgi:hypothetical protein
MESAKTVLRYSKSAFLNSVLKGSILIVVPVRQEKKCLLYVNITKQGRHCLTVQPVKHTATFTENTCPQVSKATVLRIFPTTQKTWPPLPFCFLLYILERHFRKEPEQAHSFVHHPSNCRQDKNCQVVAPLSLLLHSGRLPLVDCHVSLTFPLCHLRGLHLNYLLLLRWMPFVPTGQQFSTHRVVQAYLQHILLSMKVSQEVVGATFEFDLLTIVMLPF